RASPPPKEPRPPPPLNMLRTSNWSLGGHGRPGTPQMTTPAARTVPMTTLAEPSEAPAVPELSDLAVMIGGQGGDGTLTVSDLLGRYFRLRHLYVYTSRNVLSRIRGGHADGSIRASRDPIAAMKAQVDLILAFDAEAVEIGRPELGP